MPRAIVLLSGGLDSATTAAIARSEGYELCALTLDYGQRHRHEIEAAKRVAEHVGMVRHVVLPIDLRAFGGSSLTADIPVLKSRSTEEMEQGIPSTYVPARNTVFLSLALGFAEVENAANLFVGVNAVDYSGYPDCRPEYIEAFERLANLATKAGVEGMMKFRIHTPLIQLTKAQIIAEGLKRGMDYSLTHSCYDPTADGRACGECDSCLLRAKGFAELGLKDPALAS
jgi:7-cyano-7-deazaguanine synthase